MTLGNKIQELRKQESLSQEAFAEVMGVTRQSVSKWELDLSYPAVDKLVEIADYFHISLDELLRNDSNPTDTTHIKYDNKGDSIVDTNYDNKEGNVVSNQEIEKNKLIYMYFFWWAFLAIIIMILFGIKEYFAGFIISQVLVWSFVIMKLYSYIKRRNKVNV